MRKKKPKSQKVKRRKSPLVSGGLLNVTARAKPAATADRTVLWTLAAVGTLCVVVVAWGIWLVMSWTGALLFSENPRFTLREIQARSDGTIPETVLVEWSRVEPGGNLYSLDLPAIRRNLESQPIVRRATVRRHLPDRLDITVIERVPIARTGRTEGYMNWLVDSEGVVIRRSFEHKDLPFLGGYTSEITMGDSLDPQRAGAALHYVVRLNEMPALKRELFDLQGLSLGHPEFLVAQLRDGTQVYLPREGDFRWLLERATRKLEENRRSGRGLDTFDLRPEGPNSIGARH